MSKCGKIFFIKTNPNKEEKVSSTLFSMGNFMRLIQIMIIYFHYS
jgi:hypothetical protein